ncbi:hypothetical protein [Pseudomonas phage ANB1]|nr:hypothetical protein [Pseudomonas phage ANB1]
MWYITFIKLGYIPAMERPRHLPFTYIKYQ